MIVFHSVVIGCAIRESCSDFEAVISSGNCSIISWFKTAVKTIFFVIENISHSDLDGTMNLYTIQRLFSHIN
jgi:hypothetical protein